MRIILKERKRINSFSSISDLKHIDGLHPDIIILLKPFVKIILIKTTKNSVRKSSKISLKYRSRLLTDLQLRKGFNNNTYQGDNLKSYNRIKFTYNNFKFGLIGEKDAGEISYVDHYAGFIQYKSSGFLNNILIGDFNFEFGQGLVVWGPYSFSKGNDAITSTTKRARGFTPHLSSEENRFFRGAATTIRTSNFILNSFFSLNNIDASLTENNQISSLSYLGYHRTASELLKKDNIQNRTFGFSISYENYDFLRLSLLHVISNFNKSFMDKGEYELSGNKFNFSSVNYELDFQSFSSAGELAYNNSEFALITNLNYALNNNLEFSLSYRNYSPSYYNLYANGFGEYNNTKNEIGYYLGSKFRTKIGTFNFYYDIYNSPSESFKSEFPSSGNDLLIYYNGRIFDNTTIELKYKNEIREISKSGLFLKNLVSEHKQNIRFGISYNIGKNFFGKSRFEFVRYLQHKTSEKGFLTFQEIKYKLKSIFILTTRIIFFRTDSYNSRIYEFENDLRGLMTNLPMFGEGFRWYLLLSYRALESLNLHFKYSETYKPNETSLGSGNSEIMGNIDNKISLQIDYNL